MKTRIFDLSVHALALGSLLAVSPSAFAAEPAGGKTTAKDVSKKVEDTGKAIKDYTVAQRDEAIKKAQAALDDLDTRIGRLERKLDNDWDRMDMDARQKARAALRTLHKERNEAGEWYGGLKHSSAEGWEQVKTGFVKSYEDLKKSLTKARKEFQSAK